jgi:drug/metabolite transporter (DMT)-like permease
LPPAARDRVHVHSLLIVVQICFASLAVAGRFALRSVPPDALVLTRVAGGALIFFALARWQGGSLAIARADVPRLLACAVLGVVCNQLLFVNGLRLSSATSASMLGGTIPVFTATFAVLFGVEKWRTARFIGIALSLSGALVLIATRVKTGTAGDHPALGNAMIVVNSISYSLFLVAVRPLAAKYPPMTLVALLFATALPLVAPFGIPAWIELAPRLAAADVGFLAFIVAVPTVGAYSFNQIAMQRADASLVAIYVYLQPLFATTGAVLLLGERPTIFTALSAVLIFAGLWVSSRRSSPASPA